VSWQRGVQPSVSSADKGTRSTAKKQSQETTKATDGGIDPAIIASSIASTSTTPPPPDAHSHVLDPSLFAASFAKKRTFPSTTSQSKTESSLSHSNKPVKKRSRVAKGHDGQPMKRLKDGRTIVRVLQRDTRKQPASERTAIIEETLEPPSALDPSEVLPNAKIRGFRKQKLGLREEIQKSNAAKKMSRIEEDPLGLEDPAFMKGGEFEGLGLTPKRGLGGKSRPSPQIRGRRTKCEWFLLAKPEQSSHLPPFLWQSLRPCQSMAKHCNLLVQYRLSFIIITPLTPIVSYNDNLVSWKENRHGQIDCLVFCHAHLANDLDFARRVGRVGRLSSG
jgi:hypothetical protein